MPNNDPCPRRPQVRTHDPLNGSSLTDTQLSMKNSRAQVHNNNKTLISALLIGPNCGKMTGKPVWGQHRWVSVTIVTDKQLESAAQEGGKKKYSQTSARGTGYPLSHTVTLKSVKS